MVLLETGNHYTFTSQDTRVNDVIAQIYINQFPSCPLPGRLRVGTIEAVLCWNLSLQSGMCGVCVSFYTNQTTEDNKETKYNVFQQFYFSMPV